ncbi:MAG: hypothetical protein QME21_17465 [Anaerolineales bacterium]|nr:hypothetical protein [Anaerolineales bacterium]
MVRKAVVAIDDEGVRRLMAAVLVQAVQDAHGHDASALSFLMADEGYRLWQLLANAYLPVWTYRLMLYEQTRPYKPERLTVTFKRWRVRRQRHG